KLHDLDLIAGRLQRLCPHLRGGGDLVPALGDTDAHRGAVDGAAVGVGSVVCCGELLLEVRDLPLQLRDAVPLLLHLRSRDATTEHIEATGETGHPTQHQRDDGRQQHVPGAQAGPGRSRPTGRGLSRGTRGRAAVAGGAALWCAWSLAALRSTRCLAALRSTRCLAAL